MEQTDTQLLLACRGGDEAAWEALVKRYQRLMYAIPRRAGLDEDDAAEVFQEVFATLLRKLDEIDDPGRLHPWLVTAARRITWRAISKKRLPGHVQSLEHHQDLGSALASVPDAALLPDEALIKLEQQHKVRTSLAQLDERCRKLLTMLFYQAQPATYAEIAKALGTSEGSIGPTRARCLEKMLRILDPG